MHNHSKVHITLLVSNKAGLLSALVVKAGSLGLFYRRQNTEKVDSKTSRIILSFDGEFNCDKQQSITEFEELAEVIKVEKIHIFADNQTITEQKG